MLMEARRAVKEARATNHADQMRTARSEVDQAKWALGRGARYGGATAVQTTTATRLLTRPMLSGTAHCPSRSDHARRTQILRRPSTRH